MADLARAHPPAARVRLHGDLVLRGGHAFLGRRADPEGPRPRSGRDRTCWSSRTSWTPGLTLKYLLKNLAARKPASLEVAALLRKVGIQKVDLDVRYVGLRHPERVRRGLRARLRREVPEPAVHRHAQACPPTAGDSREPAVSRGRPRLMRRLPLLLMLTCPGPRPSPCLVFNGPGRDRRHRGHRARRPHLPRGIARSRLLARTVDRHRARDRRGWLVERGRDRWHGAATRWTCRRAPTRSLRSRRRPTDRHPADRPRSTKARRCSLDLEVDTGIR